jgi:hypothetical protein
VNHPVPLPFTTSAATARVDRARQDVADVAAGLAGVTAQVRALVEENARLRARLDAAGLAV